MTYTKEAQRKLKRKNRANFIKHYLGLIIFVVILIAALIYAILVEVLKITALVTIIDG